MVNADEALTRILNSTPLLETESVPLLQAQGRTLGVDTIVDRDLPPFDNSSMDGFALRSSDVGAASAGSNVTLRLAGEARAGKAFPRAVRQGEAVRIMTGAPIPSGADAVVPLEQVRAADEFRLVIDRPVPAGGFVRFAGEDMRKGDRVLKRGTPLGPAELGVLASLGHAHVAVFKRPVVNVLATGDELVDVGSEPAGDQIRNSTSYALWAYIVDAGAVPRLLGIAGDDRGLLKESIRQGLQGDVLIVTGGASVGKYDFVKSILEELGAVLHLTAVNIRPGRPLVFATLGGKLIFGLPGNPVSTGVTFLQFVRPALCAMMGRQPSALRLSAVMEEAYLKSDRKRHFLRGVARSEGGRLLVRLTGSQSSGVLSSLAAANCLILVPEEITSLDMGQAVEIELL